MKNVPLPSRAQLAQAYSCLQWGEEIPEPAELVLWAHWARLDARLAEILVKFFQKYFRQIHPTKLWEINLSSPQPQALAVLVSFARAHWPRKSDEYPAFNSWARAITWRIPKGAPQLFFVRDGTPKPVRDALDIGESLSLYLKWGFFGRDNLAGSKSINESTMLASEQRRKILTNLMRSRKRFTVADYLEACDRKVHRRTAERDLKSCPRLIKIGGTKGATYRVI